MTTAKRPKTYDTTIRDALEDGVSEIESLAEEMRSWYDNMPEGFQNAERGERVGEAADTLENADARRAADDLIQLLDRLCSGTPAKQGCVEHVEGTPCKVCKWDGRVHQRVIPPLVENPDPKPMRHEYNGWPGKPADVRWETLVASYNMQGCTTCFVVDGEHPDPEQLATELQRARRDWWREAEIIAKWNDTHAIPPLRPFEPEVPALQDVEEKLDAVKITLPTSKARPSRSSRLGDATGAVTAAIEALRDFVEKEPALAAHAEEIDDAITPIEEALGELEGIEFPGMYG